MDGAHVREADLTEQTRHGLAPRPVEGAVGDLERILRARLTLGEVGREQKRLDVRLMLRVDVDEVALTPAVVEALHGLGAAEEVHLVLRRVGEAHELDAVGRGRGDVVVVHLVALLRIELRAVGRGELVAVVPVVVVAGRDEDAHVRLEVRDGERHLGIRARLVEEVDRVAVGEEQLGNHAGEVLPPHAAVVADDDALEGRVLVLPELRHTDGGLQEDDLVDGVRPLEDGHVDAFLIHLHDGVAVEGHHAPDAARAEAEVLPVGIDDILPPFPLDGAEDALFQARGDPVDVRVFEPQFEVRRRVRHGGPVQLFVDAPGGAGFVQIVQDAGLGATNHFRCFVGDHRQCSP